MYKIITKMHTLRDGVGRYHMILNDEGNLVEFATDDKEEAKLEALKILKKVGYNDLRIVDEQDFYIEVNNVIDNNITADDIVEAEKILGKVGYEDLYLTNDADYDIELKWGIKPEGEQTTFTVTIVDNGEITAVPWEITDIPEHGEVQFRIQPKDPDNILGFHLFINGVICDAGIPDWLGIETFDDSTVTLTVKDITQDIALSVQFDRE
jgi:hypothetical protein